MTTAPAKREKLPCASTMGRWVHAIVSRLKRPAGLKGINRAEFEQMARDLDLPHPELYGLLTGRVVSADLLEKRLKKLDVSSEQITPRSVQEHLSAGSQAYLPIGPSCC